MLEYVATSNPLAINEKNVEKGFKYSVIRLLAAAAHGLEQNDTTLSDVYNVADCGEQWNSSFQLSKDAGIQTDTAAHQ